MSRRNKRSLEVRALNMHWQIQQETARLNVTSYHLERIAHFSHFANNFAEAISESAPQKFSVSVEQTQQLLCARGLAFQHICDIFLHLSGDITGTLAFTRRSSCFALFLFSNWCAESQILWLFLASLSPGKMFLPVVVYQGGRQMHVEERTWSEGFRGERWLLSFGVDLSFCSWTRETKDTTNVPSLAFLDL
eukprot:scaffold1439_cov282-Pinguiococcus_pyrenoidosus.AAC.3